MSTVTTGINPPGGCTVMGTTSLVKWAKGLCVGTAGTIGTPGDTYIKGVLIAQNGTAATATIAGFHDHTGAAANVVLTGSTLNSLYFPLESINDAAGFSVTCSVASTVVVLAGPST